MKTITILVVLLTIGIIGGYSIIGLPVPEEINKHPARQTVNTGNINSQLLPDRGENDSKFESANVNGELSRLSGMDLSLAQLAEQYNLPVPVATTYTGVMDIIDTLPAEFIKQQLSYLADDKYIADIDNPNEFAKSLLKVALSREQVEDFSGAMNVVFSYSPVKGWRELADDIALEKFDTLYAHISPTRDIAHAVVKWQHIESGEILQFIPLTLNLQGQSQYVVFRPGNGWYEGFYQVTIHDMDNERRVLAANSFRVSTVIQAENKQNATGPDKDILQDLILTGRAFPRANH